MNQVIPSTEEEKDLGVFFSKSFKNNLNCNTASKSANKIMGLIRRNISDRSKECMLILYKTLVRPILDYCIPVWRPHTKQDINKLERVQKIYTKMITGCKNLKYEDRLLKLGLTMLSERHERADLIQVYKILHEKKSTYPENFLQLSNREGRTNSLKLFKRRSYKDLRKYTFTSRVVDPWNRLPETVVTSTDVNGFKGNIDMLMRNSRGQL